MAELIATLEQAQAAVDELESLVDAKDAATISVTAALTERVKALTERVKDTTPGNGAGPAVSDNPTTTSSDGAALDTGTPWRSGSIL